MKPEQKDRKNKAAAAAPGNHLFADAKERIPARALKKKNRTTRPSKQIDMSMLDLFFCVLSASSAMLQTCTTHTYKKLHSGCKLSL